MDIFKSKYFKWGLTAFLVVVASTVFYFLIFYLPGILGFVGKIFKVLSALVIGLIIAYLLHPIVNFFENKVYKKMKNKTAKRNLSIATTLAIVFIVLTTIISIIIPQILTSIISLINNSDAYVKQLTDYINKVLSDGENAEKYASMINDVVTNLKSNVLPFAQTSLTKISSGIIGAFTGFLNVLIGIVFAVYILANTKNFGAGIRKTLYAFFNVDKVNKFIDNVEHVNSIFLKFMIGKVTDSSIVALCTLSFLIICKFPYAVLIAVIIGLTDLIPYFGPYIGGIPAVIVGFTISPLVGIWAIIAILIVQNLENHFYQPLIMGHTMELHPVAIIIGLLLFGHYFGLIGMIFATPIIACLKILVQFIKEKGTIQDIIEEQKIVNKEMKI